MASDAMESTLMLNPDHPALAGHFPGHPIVPGVVLLDEALHAIGEARGLSLARCKLAATKFLRPVVPPATLVIRHRMIAEATVDFSILDGDAIVASGRVELIETDR